MWEVLVLRVLIIAGIARTHRRNKVNVFWLLRPYSALPRSTGTAARERGKKNTIVAQFIDDVLNRGIQENYWIDRRGECASKGKKDQAEKAGHYKF